MAAMAASAASDASTAQAIAGQALSKTSGPHSPQRTSAKPTSKSAAKTQRPRGEPARPHFIAIGRPHTGTLGPLGGHDSSLGSPAKQFSVYNTTHSKSKIHVLTAVSGKVQFQEQERETAEGGFALWLQAQKYGKWNDDCLLSQAGMKQEFPELDGASRLFRVRPEKDQHGVGALATTCYKWTLEYQQDPPVVVRIPSGGHGWYVLLPKSVRTVEQAAPIAWRLLHCIPQTLRSLDAPRASTQQIVRHFINLLSDDGGAAALEGAAALNADGGAAADEIDESMHCEDSSTTTDKTKVVVVDGEKVRCVSGAMQRVVVGMYADAAVPGWSPLHPAIV